MLVCVRACPVLVACLSHAMIKTGCAIERAHTGALSRAVIITRPEHKISKYAADFRWQLGSLVLRSYPPPPHVNIISAPFWDSKSYAQHTVFSHRCIPTFLSKDIHFLQNTQRKGNIPHKNASSPTTRPRQPMTNKTLYLSILESL
jgi:hypothetical protein